MVNRGAELREITDFPSLLAYLRDELGWPIESDNLDEVIFEYSPEELGLKDADAAKIKQIFQLRPLVTGQPWGIFLVEFEKKKLPVVVLRRILSHLVIKKRASANAAERAAWQIGDLLFISAFGEEGTDGREIAFAHFHQPTGDLPTLRVLGWDGADTPLKLAHVADQLRTNLRWPADTADHPAWRVQWRSPFRHRLGYIIRTADVLAERLAALARGICEAAQTLLARETEKGALTKLYRAFQTALLHDLKPEDFADTYAQTVTYGLLTAAISQAKMSEGRAQYIIAETMPGMVITNPFLQEILGTFLHAGGRKGGIDFDELGIQDVVELLRGDETDLPAVLRDFGNRAPGEDPVIHFYEHFLSAYNKKMKIQRGVFYTPQAVVSYIVRSVHKLLQTEFGLEDGLASTITWGEMVKMHPGLKLPPLTDEPDDQRTISPDESFVQILDPATGTATFLVEVIDIIHKHLLAKWKQQRLTDAQQSEAWNDYVPKHLLPRLHGYELLMAPYAIAHMKIGLKLYETGYRFGTEERARIYLTNALEPWVKQLPLIGFDALAHEAAAVNEIKRHKRFTVVIGNPPYAKLSGNRSSYAESLVVSYKRLVAKERNVQPLSDDYVKFIAFGTRAISHSPISVLSMITNRSWLDGLIHRGIRSSILKDFDRVFIMDCHGDNNVGEHVPAGSLNENLFDIKQGVAICCFARLGGINIPPQLGEIWGSQGEKYTTLNRGILQDTTKEIVQPSAPNFFFRSGHTNTETISYQSFPSLVEIFGSGDTRADQGKRYGNGIKSNRDSLLIDFDKVVLKRQILSFADAAIGDDQLKRQYDLEDGPYWNTQRERRKVKPDTADLHLLPITYRPFDQRWIWYQVDLIQIGRGGASPKLMQNFIKTENLALLSSRNTQNPDFTSVFCTRSISEMKTAESTRASYCFPIYINNEFEGLGLLERRLINFAPAFLKHLADTLGISILNKQGLTTGLTPEDIFYYIYAVFHSPGYRSRYAEFLKIDFPRLPLTGNLELFRALARFGGELVALHLLESPRLDHLITSFIGARNPEVEKVSWSQQTVWIDKGQSIGFRGVPEAVWNFHIGGYQVCEKWLKDRKGRMLSDDDIAHYHKIVVALTETIRLMAEIDEVIDKHGGWPGAFQPRTDTTA